ncbi:hypothetical protein [Sphaerisporangium fuscum]|uniref:hypothetical protein n=1 Tax=Sphaerisporangium fuscum TaxID=2835868 RepID=UPI001BDCD931|nr:hypothetical protein [Sphaerisporangium fuscum]
MTKARTLPGTVALTATATLLAAPALTFTAAPASARTVRSSPQPAAPASCVLGNGGFEEPAGLQGPGNLRKDGSGWHTTAPDGLIEIWAPGNAGPAGSEVVADSGSQFAELNGTRPSALYQDIATEPRSVLVWRLAHRARSVGANEKDVIQVRIGAPGASGTVQIPLGQISGDIADGGTWGHHTGVYRVPRGQKVTRISLEAASGSPSAGGFLDSVEIACSAPGVKVKLPGTTCHCPGLPQPRHPATPPARPSHPRPSQIHPAQPQPTPAHPAQPQPAPAHPAQGRPSQNAPLDPLPDQPLPRPAH